MTYICIGIYTQQYIIYHVNKFFLSNKLYGIRQIFNIFQQLENTTNKKCSTYPTGLVYITSHLFEDVSHQINSELNILILYLKHILQNLLSNRAIFHLNYFFYFTFTVKTYHTIPDRRNTLMFVFSYKYIILNHSNSFIHVSQRNQVLLKFPNSFLAY